MYEHTENAKVDAKDTSAENAGMKENECGSYERGARQWTDRTMAQDLRKAASANLNLRAMGIQSHRNTVSLSFSILVYSTSVSRWAPSDVL